MHKMNTKITKRTFLSYIFYEIKIKPDYISKIFNTKFDLINKSKVLDLEMSCFYFEFIFKKKNFRVIIIQNSIQIEPVNALKDLLTIEPEIDKLIKKIKQEIYS